MPVFAHEKRKRTRAGASRLNFTFENEKKVLLLYGIYFIHMDGFIRRTNASNGNASDETTIWIRRMAMRIGFVSLGCSKNLIDSEKIMGMVTAGGHTLVNHPKDAEAIIINTCGFINSAKEEAIQTIFEMAQYKQKQLKKLIVVGCLAQRYRDDLIREIPEIDCVISIREYPRMHEILKDVLEGRDLVSYGKSERLLATKPWTAYLKIAEGCSNHCTYCAIPLIRGDNVSVSMEELIAEAKALAQRGVKELVLIAQDTTKYGLDLYGRLSLSKLLRQLNEIEGLHWIRILYMYPDEIDDELIREMAKLSKVLPYFDIPLQHANDHMLRLMNRRGNMKQVRRLIERIRTYHPQATLRTTFIVGFPQETRADFDDLLAFVKEVKWDRMGAFAYSSEEDTPAFSFDGAVDEAIKQERLDELMQLQKEISFANLKAMIGRQIEVLVEGQNGLSGVYRGRGIANAPDGVDGLVYFRCERSLDLGSFVQVTITDAQAYDLIGVCQ